MNRVRHTITAISLSLLCNIGHVTAAAPTDAKPSALAVKIDIAPQPMNQALNAFAQQTGLQLLMRADAIPDTITAPRLVGTYTAQDALEKLLANTVLGYKFIDARTVAIRARGAPTIGVTQAVIDEAAVNAVHLAQVDAPPSSNIESRNEAHKKDVEEIIVTAQKRAERLQDVPVPVAAIDADTLVDSNQLRLQDYFVRIPGLNLRTGNRGEPFVAIRGITNLGGNPTVGFTVDDVPYGPSTLTAAGFIAPDLDPSDLSRIEVLRGPQGTLYGVSSLGGLIKYVTSDPSTEGFTGRIQTGLTGVSEGDDLGFNVRGAVNVPLSDTLAVRASAYKRLDPGYVDNPALNIRDINERDAAGGRLAALWKPADTFSVKLAAQYQERNTHGSSLVYLLPGLGDLQQSYLKDSGWYNTEYQAYSAVLTGKVGNIDIVSLSGYNISRVDDSVDLTPFFGPLTDVFFPGTGASGVPDIEHIKTDKFTQEIRISASLGDRFDWLFGGFYTNEKSSNIFDVPAVNPSTGARAGSMTYNDGRSTYEEYAAFTNLTVHFSDRFDIQFGARQGQNKQSNSGVAIGVLNGGTAAAPATVITPRRATDDDAFTYLVTPRLRVSPDLMIYMRAASGYRAGVMNDPLTAPILASKPDMTQNYEIGIKGAILGRTLSFDASLFYLDWEDIQLQYLIETGPSAGTAFNTNGSRARSRGVELSVESRPLTGLAIAASLSWNEADLTEDLGLTSPLAGRPGDPLPFTGEFAGSVSVDQEFPLFGGNATGFVGSTVSYLGERTGDFRGSAGPGLPDPQREEYPGFTQVDARAGVEFGSWTGNLFVTNIADKRGELGGGIGALNPNSFIYIQPRTFGISIAKTF